MKPKEVDNRSKKGRGAGAALAAPSGYGGRKEYLGTNVWGPDEAYINSGGGGNIDR